MDEVDGEVDSGTILDTFCLLLRISPLCLTLREIHARHAVGGARDQASAVKMKRNATETLEILWIDISTQTFGLKTVQYLPPSRVCHGSIF